MARKPTALDQARLQAMKGETDAAIEAIQRFADVGDASASASLAELFAFRGRWSDVIPHAGRLVANSKSVYAGNVFNDMIRLLGRAGHETNDWTQIADVVVSARESIDQIGLPHHVQTRQFTILNCLEEYALRKGGEPHELIAVFDAGFSFSQADMDEAYDKAVYTATQSPEWSKQSRKKVTDYLFAISINFSKWDDLLRIYREGGMPPTFNNAVHVARQLVNRSEMEDGWQVLWDHLSLWWPVDLAQVAPVELLTDPALRLLMTPERCEQTLALPRGPGANQTP